MKKQRIEVFITGVLIVVFFILLISSLLNRKGKQIIKETSITEVVSNSQGKIEVPKESGWGRDPFNPAPKTKSIEGQVFVLSACVWDSENPLVVINGEVVCVGDEISGYKVERINKDSAVLRKGDEVITLELYE